MSACACVHSGMGCEYRVEQCVRCLYNGMYSEDYELGGSQVRCGGQGKLKVGGLWEYVWG